MWIKNKLVDDGARDRPEDKRIVYFTAEFLIEERIRIDECGGSMIRRHVQCVIACHRQRVINQPKCYWIYWKQCDSLCCFDFRGLCRSHKNRTLVERCVALTTHINSCENERVDIFNQNYVIPRPYAVINGSVCHTQNDTTRTWKKRKRKKKTAKPDSFTRIKATYAIDSVNENETNAIATVSGAHIFECFETNLFLTFVWRAAKRHLFFSPVVRRISASKSTSWREHGRARACVCASD